MNSRKKGPRGKGHFESTPADPSNVLLSYSITSHPIISALLGTKARVEGERKAVYIGGTVNATGVCNI